MQIKRRAVGDVVVIELLGKLTLGDGDELLKNAILSVLAEEARKFVLNLQDVPYIDSAGLGELVRTYATIRRRGGELVVSHPSPRIFDVLTMTKLKVVYEVLPSVADAVAVLESRERGNALFDSTCPVCKPVGKRRFSVWTFFDPGVCFACGVEFRLIRPERPLVEVVDRSSARLWSMSLPTYQGEAVHVHVGDNGCVIRAPRRLDLFSMEVLEKAWSVIPQPRRIALDVSEVEEFTDVAIARLLPLGDGTCNSDSAIYLTQADEYVPPSPIAPRLAQTGRAYDAAAEEKFNFPQWAGPSPVISVAIAPVNPVA